MVLMLYIDARDGTTRQQGRRGRPFGHQTATPAREVSGGKVSCHLLAEEKGPRPAHAEALEHWPQNLLVTKDPALPEVVVIDLRDAPRTSEPVIGKLSPNQEATSSAKTL